MEIEFYRAKCLELRQKFGEASYTRDALNDAWGYWKHKDDRAFGEFVSKIISLPFPTKLIPIDEKPLNDEYECPQKSLGGMLRHEDNRAIQVNFDRISNKLAELGAGSISELLGQKEKINSLIKLF